MHHSTQLCLVMLIVAMVIETGFSRSYKKRPYGDHHVAIDDSLDPDWSSLSGIDDVASWFDQLQDRVNEDQQHSHQSSIAATTTRTTLSTTTSSPATSPRRRLRGSSHVEPAARSRQERQQRTTISSVWSPTPASVRAPSVTLSGIVDITGHGGLDHEEIHHTENDACQGVYCRAGRVCQPPSDISSQSVRRGRCVCADSNHCLNTHISHRGHQVCGTDGHWYPSHCELHRVACISGTHRGVDSSATSCSSSQVAVSPDTDTELYGKPSELEIESVTVAPPTRADNVNVSEVFQVESKRGSCTETRFDRMKDSVLSYHCARDSTYDCSSDIDKKKFVVADMFEYYDWSGDNRLEPNEMISVEQRDHLDRLSQHCRLDDLLTYCDIDKDGFISMSEFYTAFGVDLPGADKTLQIFRTAVTFGNSVELKCDSTSSSVGVVWKRNGIDLSDLDDQHIKVFDDGSLYIGQLSLHHIGNYTCQNNRNGDVIQTHVLLVQMPPRVHVSPAAQSHLAGSTAVLKCRADGLPTPDISWQLNDSQLPAKGQNYFLLHNNATIEIKSSVQVKPDTGSYKCVAKNSAGTSSSVGTVEFQHDDLTDFVTSDVQQTELMAVFHRGGYTVYELNRCHVDHQVGGQFEPISKLPMAGGGQSQTPGSMCSNVSSCDWSDAVSVRGRFIYAAQPTLDRIVVIESTDRLNPVEVIMTDKRPIRLQYVNHLDQVWVLCQSIDSHDMFVVMVIREASENIVHHAVHTQQFTDSAFDTVSGVFLLSPNDLGYSTDIGYVVHSGKTVLQKMELSSMKYIADIDLTRHLCVPVDVVLLPIGGRVAISCAAPDDVTAQPRQTLILDHVTDEVIDTLQQAGRLFVSPDMRSLLVLSNKGSTISVYTVSDAGVMTHAFDEHTELELSHVTFFPSATSHHGYTAIMASTQHATVLQLDLTSGKIQLIKGVQLTSTSSNGRNIIATGSGQFASHVVTLADQSVVVIDGVRHHVDCEWLGVASPMIAVSLAG